MLPALNIPALLSPQCPRLPLTFPSATAKQRYERYHLPMEFVKQYFSVSLPLPLTFPLPILSGLPFPLSILCSHHFPCPIITALHMLLTLAIIVVIAITRTAPSAAWRSGIHLVLIIIFLFDYLIPVQWSHGQEVVWLVQPASWWISRCPGIIATVPRDTLAGVFDLSQAGCLRIGVID